MNISFFDGVNDGKFYSINAGKYDELGEEENIDISESVNEEIEDEDGDTCLNRFAALEKDASKLHMDLNNLRNEFKGSCKDWNNLSDTVDHMLNSIAELKTIMNKADDRLNKRLNVISEANVVLTDKLNLVEKKLEVFKCIDILDRVTKLEERYETGIITFNELRDKLKKLDIDVTSNMENNMDKANDRMGIIEKKLTMFYDILDRVMKLEEQVKPTALEEAKELEVRPSVLDDILDRLGKLEEDSVSAQQSIASVVTKDIRDDVRLHHIDNKLKELEEQVKPIVQHDILERRWKGYHWVPFDYKFGAKTESVEEFEKRVGISWKYAERPFESDKNDIQSDAVNHPSHYTDGKYETIDFIEEYGMVTHIGNAIKYTSRAGKKDEDAYVEDLEKALWYLHRYNCPPKKKHIDAFDYCKDKKLPDELTRVIMYISRENYVEAERVLRKYIEELKK